MERLRTRISELTQLLSTAEVGSPIGIEVRTDCLDSRKSLNE